MLPGLSVLGVFFVANIIMMDILTEREKGTLRRLLTGPVTVGRFLVAKVTVAVLACIAAMVLLVAVSAAFLGTQWGNPLALSLVSVAMTLAVVGTMTLIYGLARTRKQVEGVSNLVIVSMCLFGGSFFPREEMPTFMQAVGKWTINYWAIDGLRAVINGDPTTYLLRCVGILLAVGLVTLAVGIWAMRRRLAVGDNL
jgi:ABC-2 type transport system permease protein